MPNLSQKLKAKDYNKTTMDDTDTDFALKAVSKIFDVMVWHRNIPPCYFQWIRNNLKNKTWQLGVIQFKPITCKSTIKSNGIVDIEYFECGFKRAVRGDLTGGFKNKNIKQGNHQNLHQIIHRLHDWGVEFDQMDIEERFNGGNIVDVLGVKGENYIVVELGEWSKIDKLMLADEENVEALWFGDNNKFIYSLSRKAPRTHQVLRKEAEDYAVHFVNHYLNHCKGEGRAYSCFSSPYNAWNCNTIRRFAEDFLGLKT